MRSEFRRYRVSGGGKVFVLILWLLFSVLFFLPSFASHLDLYLGPQGWTISAKDGGKGRMTPEAAQCQLWKVRLCPLGHVRYQWLPEECSASCLEEAA